MTNTPQVNGWTLAQRLKFARAGAGLDQQQIAEAVGASRPSVSGYERGLTEPSASVFVRWANATGVTLDWLAEGVETEMAPADNGGSQIVRPKGFEPLTFWSVVEPDVDVPIPDTVDELLESFAACAPVA